MDRLRAVPAWGWGAATVVLIGGVVAGVVIARPGASPAATASLAPAPSSSGAALATVSPSPSASPSTEVAAFRCPLNGAPVPSLPPAGQPALIVQVENHPAARPGRNLSRADIVIEATVEGDTTRFSAVFYCQPTLGLTGPVRSARYYSIDLWQQIHGLTVHFGASGPSLERFAKAGMPSINGITGAWPFFRRSGTAPAPHNLYGDIEAVRTATLPGGSAAGLLPAVGTLRPPFTVEPDASPPAGTPVNRVALTTTSTWRFGWVWDAALGAWQRTDAGVRRVDAATGQPVVATSVVVQRITESIVYGDPDPGGNPRRDLHLVGSGNGWLYVNGHAIAVHWSRPNAASLTTWTYADGSPMVLPPGPIWWELIPSGGTVTNS